MIIYPAIDIKDGKCVRLLQGLEDKVTVYGNDPVAMALKWQKHGAEIIHVVDLDGAFQGKPKNAETVRRIVQALDIPVQFGGGVRNIESIVDLVEMGVGQIVLGTVAITEPSMFERSLELFGDRIVVGLDGRSGKVAIQGWTKDTGEDVIQTGRKLADMGVRRIIYTDISRDGMQTGPNLAATRALAKAAGIPVTASGGVSTLKDIMALKEAEAEGIEGVIVGKALYEKSFSLEEALKAAM
jgi:phosphoribosylformimino-5-aminoimidazole carboxamide ribotide isomerase